MSAGEARSAENDEALAWWEETTGFLILHQTAAQHPEYRFTVRFSNSDQPANPDAFHVRCFCAVAVEGLLLGRQQTDACCLTDAFRAEIVKPKVRAFSPQAGAVVYQQGGLWFLTFLHNEQFEAATYVIEESRKIDPASGTQRALCCGCSTRCTLASSRNV